MTDLSLVGQWRHRCGKCGRFVKEATAYKENTDGSSMHAPPSYSYWHDECAPGTEVKNV